MRLRLSQNKLLGWPQIIIYASGKDFAGREVIVAYGNTHIPTCPGRHLKTVKMYKPISSSILTRIYGWIAGKSSECKFKYFYFILDLIIILCYIDRDAPKAMAKADGRSITRVIPNGSLKIAFQITNKNLKEQDYVTGN